jgi:thiazole/oxazole-forming peptide maturase SagD family component
VSAPAFAAPLAGPECAELRERLAALLRGPGHPAVVDTLLGVYARTLRGELPGGPAKSYLLFDFHRVVLYDEPDDADGPRIGSVALWMADAYPHQPADRFAAHAEAEPFRFLYGLGALEVLGLLWARRRPGVVTVCDLASGEIVSDAARVHPEACAPLPSRGPGELAPEPPLPIQARWTDATLRRRRKPAAAAVRVSAAMGVPRELQETRDAADLPLAAMHISWNGGRYSQPCFGKGLRAGAAAAVAEYEASERCGAIFQRADEALVHATLGELGGLASDPRLLFYDQPTPPDGGAPFSDEERLHWTWATDPLRGRAVLVPAQEVWFRTRGAEERAFVRPTTNACALGGSVEEASLFALFEAIERDAFMAAWYTRRPCAPIDPDSVEHEGFQLLRRRFALAYPDYRFHLFDATTDLAVPVVLGVAVRMRGSGPRSFTAAASRLSAERACLTALGDLAGFYPQMREERRTELRRLLDEPERVKGPSDHYGLYALDETFERLGFLDFEGPPRTTVREMERRRLVPPASRYDLRALLVAIAERVESVGASVLLKDVTHPWVAARGLRCVRALTPGLYPIWFGAHAVRFAVTERLARLGHEWTGRTFSSPDDFCLEMHPFS